MEEKATDTAGTGGISETELLALLSGLKLEATPEADFESRFLYDFHERVARESVCRPARRLLWEHLLQCVANFGRRRLAYGASTLGIGALAVGFFTWPGESGSPAMAAHVAAPGLERSLSSILSSSSREVDACTSITVQSRKDDPFTGAVFASSCTGSPFESASILESRPQRTPINMGMAPGVGESFPSFSTSASF